MKNIISEIIKLELIGNLLSEGRIEDTKSKFPEDTEVIDYFVDQDPSGNNKYLNWEMKVYKQLPPNAPAELKERHKELIVNLIKGFHQHSQRLQMRDINQYKSLADLNTAVSPLIKASEEKVAEKLKQEEGSFKLYEDIDWLLIVPLTYEASCKYGANTQWCVASRDTKDHFEWYTETGLLVYLIHKKSNNKFAFYHDYDEDGGSVEIYNPVDYNISWDFDIKGSVENFLQGLVRGKMGEYLEEDYDDDEYSEYEIRYNNKSFVSNGFDDLSDRVVEIVLKHYLGRGSGRNSLQKYKDVFKIFGLTLELQGKKQDSPFIIKDEKGEIIEDSTQFRSGNRAFNVIAKNGGINILLWEYIYDIIENQGVDGLKRIIAMASAYQPKYTNVDSFRIEIIGPEFTEKKSKDKDIDLTKVMSKKQASSIYKAYIDGLSKAEEEKNKRIEGKMNEILAGVTVNTQKFEVCYYPNDKIFDILGSLPDFKKTVIEELRYEGIIKGRLPRNWPSTPEQKEQFLSQSEKYRFLRSCLIGLNGGLALSNIPITKTIKNGKKRTSTLGWLHNKLSEIGLKLGDSEDLLKILIDRQKTKK